MLTSSRLENEDRCIVHFELDSQKVNLQSRWVPDLLLETSRSKLVVEADLKPVETHRGTRDLINSARLGFQRQMMRVFITMQAEEEEEEYDFWADYSDYSDDQGNTNWVSRS